ncbi:hypothetical protein RB593_000127 [Gaeumannomyces tritici]
MAAQINLREQGLTVLHQAEHPKVDIVFVHGFTGHPKNTWTWQRAKHGPSHQKRKHDPGEGSSSGGVRKFLKVPFRKKDRSPSPTATSSSTPGPSFSETTRTAATSAGTERQDIREEVYWPKDLVPQTVPSSRVFTYGYDTNIRHWINGPIGEKTDLSDEFAILFVRKQWPVYSFQEEYGVTLLSGAKVVNDHSSCLDDVRIETKRHISSNHMDMCRFSGLEDAQYTKVSAAMTFIIGRATALDARPEAPHQVSQPGLPMVPTPLTTYPHPTIPASPTDIRIDSDPSHGGGLSELPFTANADTEMEDIHGREVERETSRDASVRTHRNPGDAHTMGRPQPRGRPRGKRKGHTDDIEQFIKARLRLGSLGKTAKAAPLRNEIRDKSSGIFLWVVLVIEILNRELINSTASISASIDKLNRRFKEIPPGLYDLFEMILARDGNDLHQLDLCLKWVLFATRPLKPQELYFAVQFGLDKDTSGLWDREDIIDERLDAFVSSSSKGLAEVTRNKASQVQFIHESVRDFLLDRYGQQWSGASVNFEGHSHDVLRDCCWAQLNAPVGLTVDIPDELLDKAKAARTRAALRHNFPFLEYAVSGALAHANSAQQHGVEQGRFLENFPLSQWAIFSNALEQFAVRRYSKSVDLLYILAERNMSYLIPLLCSDPKTFFSAGKERYGPSMFAALATESHDAVATMLQGIQKTYQRLPPPLQNLAEHHFKDLAALYLHNRGLHRRFPRDMVFSSRKTLLSYMVPAMDGSDMNSTYVAILLAYLLLSPPDIDTALLFCATVLGYDSIVQSLLDTGHPDLNVKDEAGRTLAANAAAEGHARFLQMLLYSGKVRADSIDQIGASPLSWAARNGHQAVVQLLLNSGNVDVNRKDKRGRTVFLWAAENGHHTAVKLLLDSGKAAVDIQDIMGETALYWAARNGHQAVVQLLLDSGKAAVDIQDTRGQTALHWAVERGRHDVVRLLEEHASRNP